MVEGGHLFRVGQWLHLAPSHLFVSRLGLTVQVVFVSLICAPVLLLPLLHLLLVVQLLRPFCFERILLALDELLLVVVLRLNASFRENGLNDESDLFG